ncbi:MAG: NAD(P)-binding protein [Candidatus Methylacidiphilales bacterium]|nr:NAD(P)-binding protein [Candidatus Methylacidiphilales bacterium]
MASPLSIAVIGAGMAGVAAARVLHDAGCRVVVFEKSRGFGGRCATKRWREHRVDHGAQYFTRRTEPFRKALEQSCGSSIRSLAAPILGPDEQPLPDEPRFYHATGNSHLARDLAQGLDVRLEQKIEKPQPQGTQWIVGGESFDRVLSTAPWPQTRALAGLGLDSCSTPNEPYAPCLTLVLEFEGTRHGLTPSAYGISRPEDPVLAWTACENHKTGRVTGDRTVLVAQASAPFSQARFEEDPALWSAELGTLASAAWQLGNLEPTALFTHRWRYAKTTAVVTTEDLPEGWWYAGDAIAHPRVESAWESGHHTALTLLAKTST